MLRLTGVEPRLVNQTYGDSELESHGCRHNKNTENSYWSWGRFKGRLFLLSTDILHWILTYWHYFTVY